MSPKFKVPKLSPPVSTEPYKKNIRGKAGLQALGHQNTPLPTKASLAHTVKEPEEELQAPPEKGMTARMPTLWQRGLAGVSLAKGPGAGEERLDEICKKNGWTWGLVATVSREEHTEVGAIVIIGQLFEGRAAALTGNDMMKPWDAADEALGQIAELLEDKYGR